MVTGNYSERHRNLMQAAKAVIILRMHKLSRPIMGHRKIFSIYLVVWSGADKCFILMW